MFLICRSNFRRFKLFSGPFSIVLTLVVINWYMVSNKKSLQLYTAPILTIERNHQRLMKLKHFRSLEVVSWFAYYQFGVGQEGNDGDHLAAQDVYHMIHIVNTRKQFEASVGKRKIKELTDDEVYAIASPDYVFSPQRRLILPR